MPADSQAGVQASPGTVEPKSASTAPVIGQFDVRFAPPLREQLQTLIAGSAEARLRFPVTSDRAVDLVITRHEEQDSQRGVVFAMVDDQPASSAVLAYVNDAVAGTIQTSAGELFQVRYSGNGVHRIVQLDPSRFPNEAESQTPPSLSGAPLLAGQTGHQAAAFSPAMRADTLSQTPPSGATDPFAPVMLQDAAPLASQLQNVADKDGDTVVDLMIVYTPQSRAGNGGSAGMRAAIDAAVATTNLAFANSQVGMRLRLVYAGEVAYASSSDLATDLYALARPSDGLMDEIHALRAQYNADLISLFVPPSNDGAAGIGYLVNPEGGPSHMYQWGFTTVVDLYADSNLTLAHEIGHNLGLSHAQGDPGSGSYYYAHAFGYRFTAGGQTYRDVMAYAPGIRIPYFSSYSLTYLGAPLGTATADNARALRHAKRISAGGRESIVDWTLSLAGDLNADAKSDMVWRNLRTGHVISWVMDGGFWTSTPNIWQPATATDADWIPMTSGDFNGDGKRDLVWRHADSGRVIAWYMNDTTRTGTAAIWPATNPGDADWVPMAAADFNGDSKTDLVWRNSTSGRVIVWYMDGVARTGTAAIWPATNPGESAWVPMAAADFNFDGKPDLIWRNSASGRVIVWFMDGATRTGTAPIWAATNPGESAWRPMGTGDFNADGHADIVWRNAETGQVIVWLMSGTGCIGALNIWS